jgi:DNA polymerase-3 subunit delta
MNYLIVGDSSTELIYSDLIDKITKETPNITTKIFDSSLKEEDLFFQSISINSMFGGKELIILKRAEKVDKIWNFFKALNNFNIVNKDIIIIYTTHLDDFGRVTKPFSKKAMDAAKNGNFKIIEVEDKKGDTTTNYIMNTLKVDKSTAIKFKEMVGDDISTLRQEIQKVNNFLDGESFSFEKLKNIITISKEYNTFDMVKELLQGKKKHSLEHLKKSQEYAFFLAILQNELLTLLKLRILFEEGEIKSLRNYNTFKIAFEKNKNLFRNKKGFAHPYGVFLKLPLIENLSAQKIQNHLDKTLEIEKKFKSGEGELEIMLEMFILEI